MDMNIPGTDAWEMALGKPKSNLLTSQLRPEKQALDIVDTRSGRLTSSESAKPQDEQIREAAKEFESVFLFQMLKQVRNSIHKEEGLMNGGLGEEMFTGMLDEEYAKVMANSNPILWWWNAKKTTPNRRTACCLVQPNWRLQRLSWWIFLEVKCERP